MARVNVWNARRQLSRILKRVEAGEEIVLARNGAAIARLVPFEPGRARTPGLLHGTVEDAFFDDLPESEVHAWEGG